MRVGILTFHRAHNYGAVLQCYALQHYLSSLGHDVSVIDYNNRQLWSGYDWRDKKYERAILRNIIKLPVRLIRYLWNRRKQIVRYYKFVNFQETKLELSETKSISESPYDLILIGSDQVWNTNITHGIDPYYWGTFDCPSKTKIATYAASLRAFWKENEYEDIYKALTQLKGISVRESSLREYINSIFPDLQVSCVPDPVLLLSSEQWKAIAKIPRKDAPYAFFYQAETSDDVYNTAVEIAKKQGLPLYVLSASQWAVNSKECHTASPQDFLGWLLNAKLVITSSFHALAFCIIFKKDFYVMNLNHGHDDRLKNLVAKFNLKDRLINSENQCLELVPFENETVLMQMREEANTYLNDIMIC